MATRKKRAITHDEDLQMCLNICLNAFPQIAQEQPQAQYRTGYTIGNVTWLLRQLAASPQFTQEQQALFTQIDEAWDHTLFPPEPVAVEDRFVPVESHI